MQYANRAFWAFLALLAALWLAADLSLFPVSTWMAARDPAIQLTGVLAIGCMSAGVLLALRPRWLEERLGGLDKMYRLHRSLGIAALVLSVLHWIITQAPKWLSAAGLLQRGRRPSRPPSSGEGIEQLLRSQRHLAESLGEWAFYAAVALILAALVTRIPYRVFYKTHRLLAFAYLMLAYHTLVLFRFGDWATPLGAATILLLAGGLLGAAASLLGRIGARRKVRGAVTELCYYPELRVLEGEFQVSGEWPGHKPGQFAFVTSSRAEGGHPFTIASAWDPAVRRLTFIAKELGDFTATLKDRARVGDEVTLEGPYGRFTFEDGGPVQIWIGGGIGITPFIARMKQLAAQPQPAPQAVHLFHTTADYSEEAISKLTRDAKAAGVRLHVLYDPRDGLLTGERIRAEVPEWRAASIWFCGPPGFGADIKQDFVRQGFDASRFHQEFFNWR